MFTYTIDEINRLGEKDTKYGITYWAKTLEEDTPVMFNSMEELEVNEQNPTISITAEERVEKQSAKGNNYYRLKKVRVGQAIIGGTPKTSTESTAEMVKFTASNQSFEKEVLERLDTLTAMITDLGAQNGPSKVISDNEETIDLKDIPF